MRQACRCSATDVSDPEVTVADARHARTISDEGEILKRRQIAGTAAPVAGIQVNDGRELSAPVA